MSEPRIPRSEMKNGRLRQVLTRRQIVGEVLLAGLLCFLGALVLTVIVLTGWMFWDVVTP